MNWPDELPPKEWLDSHGVVLVSKELWEQIAREMETKFLKGKGVHISVKR